MISKTPVPGTKVDEPTDTDTNTDPTNKKVASAVQAAGSTDSDDASAMIRIKRTYNFAGRVHTEEKLVARDSAEAKLYLASQGDVPPTEGPEKRATRKAFRSAFEPQVDLMPQRSDLNLGMAARIKAGKEVQAKKLNVVDKSRMDWAGYVGRNALIGSSAARSGTSISKSSSELMANCSIAGRQSVEESKRLGGERKGGKGLSMRVAANRQGRHAGGLSVW